MTDDEKLLFFKAAERSIDRMYDEFGKKAFHSHDERLIALLAVSLSASIWNPGIEAAKEMWETLH